MCVCGGGGACACVGACMRATLCVRVCAILHNHLCLDPCRCAQYVLAVC